MTNDNLKLKAKNRAFLISFSIFLFFTVIAFLLLIFLPAVLDLAGFTSSISVIFFSVIIACAIFMVMRNTLKVILKKSEKQKFDSIEDKVYDSIVKKEKLIAARNQNAHLEGTLSISQDDSTRGELSKSDDEKGRLSKK